MYLHVDVLFLKDIHTSRNPAHVPDCGHLLHKSVITIINIIVLNYNCSQSFVVENVSLKCWKMGRSN